MVKLETIFDALGDEYPPPLPSRPSTVSLPHLTSLKIDAFHERSLELVSRLVIPVTASVLVDFRNLESHHFSHPIMVTFRGISRLPRAILLEETPTVLLRLSADSLDLPCGGILVIDEAEL
ncbi:hypothetical protein BV25DRAFT_1922845 [Artomyces pyxidatus]|uniref:Uncharacterized protein n=1 Tax=Artomyces pyxidatus TaxID=48021 RepID=A0ACB8SEB0_9AGAM|nr:hypothetical protein BV25DRAFT_1922845 [Artomyces pyxidatus]